MLGGMQLGPSSKPESFGGPASPQVPVLQEPHCPQLSHVWYAQGPHPCVAPGEQTGCAGHEQAPHAQLEVQYCVPYPLHPCCAPGPHTPWLLQLPMSQLPIESQGSVAVPQ
jgi:hypothetical protein